MSRRCTPIHPLWAQQCGCPLQTPGPPSHSVSTSQEPFRTLPLTCPDPELPHRYSQMCRPKNSHKQKPKSSLEKFTLFNCSLVGGSKEETKVDSHDQFHPDTLCACLRPPPAPSSLVETAGLASSSQWCSHLSPAVQHHLGPKPEPGPPLYNDSYVKPQLTHKYKDMNWIINHY